MITITILAFLINAIYLNARLTVTHCTDEGSVCACNDHYTAYGAGGSWNIKNTGMTMTRHGHWRGWKSKWHTHNCNNEAFGDPIYGVKKTCICMRGKYNVVAEEGGISKSCTGMLIYGYGRKWHGKKGTGGHQSCTTSYFRNDPYPGKKKYCICR